MSWFAQVLVATRAVWRYMRLVAILARVTPVAEPTSNLQLSPPSRPTAAGQCSEGGHLSARVRGQPGHRLAVEATLVSESSNDEFCLARVLLM